MPVLKVGGSEYKVSTPSFKVLKNVWPIIRDMQKTGGDIDPIDAISSVIKVASIAAKKDHPGLTEDFIEENLSPSEMSGISVFLTEFMVEAGLTPVNAKGEAVPPATTSTETSTA